jgi:hypothetical protein
MVLYTSGSVSAWLYEMHFIPCQMQVLMTSFLYKNFSVRELNKVCLQGKRPYRVRFWIWTD